MRLGRGSCAAGASAQERNGAGQRCHAAARRGAVKCRAAAATIVPARAVTALVPLKWVNPPVGAGAGEGGGESPEGDARHAEHGRAVMCMMPFQLPACWAGSGADPGMPLLHGGALCVVAWTAATPGRMGVQPNRAPSGALRWLPVRRGGTVSTRADDLDPLARDVCNIISKYSPQYVRNRVLKGPGDYLQVLVSAHTGQVPNRAACIASCCECPCQISPAAKHCLRSAARQAEGWGRVGKRSW